MSLRDTIEAARKEAEEAGNIPGSGSSRKGEEQVKAETEERPEHTGFSKKSVTRARPAREAAQGVRVVDQSKVRSGKPGKPESEMTKEERKEVRRTRRELQDRRAAASRIILKKNPDYSKGQRIWWILIGFGFACTIISTVMVSYFPNAEAGFGSLAGILSLILIVVAYGAIIAALVYDFRKVRPLRNATDDLVASMTEKKVASILEEGDLEANRKSAEKAKAKAAKNAERNNKRHEQHR